MKVKTDIETLKNVWNLLKELELQSILDGGDYKLKSVKTIDQLLSNDKLNEFCQIVTGKDVDFNKLDISEVLPIVQDFFSVTATAFNPLVAGILKEVGANLSKIRKIPSGS